MAFFIYKGRMLAHLEKISEAIEHNQKGIALSKYLNNSYGLAYGNTLLGVIYSFAGDFNQALDSYLQAMTLNRTLHDKISLTIALTNLSSVYAYRGELDEFISKISKYEELVQQQISITDLIELTRLEDVFVKMVYKKTVEMPDLPPEELIITLIVTDTGMCLFSKSFVTATRSDDQLISGLLTAINQFSNEVFSQNIDPVKFKDYTLLLKVKEPFLFCYFFNGHSYTALKKPEQLVSKVSSNESTWAMLLECKHTSRALSSNEHYIIG